VTQYRTQILGLRHQLDPANAGLHSSLDKQHLKNVQAENVGNLSHFKFFWMVLLFSLKQATHSTIVNIFFLHFCSVVNFLFTYTKNFYATYTALKEMLRSNFSNHILVKACHKTFLLNDCI